MIDKKAWLVQWLGYYLDEHGEWRSPAGLVCRSISDVGKTFVGMERIKAKLRELGLRYQLDYDPSLERCFRHNLCVFGHGKWAGLSEGDVLTECALFLIEKGETDDR